MEDKTISVPMSSDEQGLFGRECPYCGYTDILGDFLTQDQRAYLESVAARDILGPLLRGFADDLNRLDTPSNGFIQLKISATVPDFPIQYYQERILETDVTCDTCGSVFAIYGVFSNCPICGKLNARVVFDNLIGYHLPHF